MPYRYFSTKLFSFWQNSLFETFWTTGNQCLSFPLTRVYSLTAKLDIFWPLRLHGTLHLVFSDLIIWLAVFSLALSFDTCRYGFPGLPISHKVPPITVRDHTETVSAKGIWCPSAQEISDRGMWSRSPLPPSVHFLHCVWSICCTLLTRKPISTSPQLPVCHFFYVLATILLFLASLFPLLQHSQIHPLQFSPPTIFMCPVKYMYFNNPGGPTVNCRTSQSMKLCWVFLRYVISVC